MSADSASSVSQPSFGDGELDGVTDEDRSETQADVSGPSASITGVDDKLASTSLSLDASTDNSLASASDSTTSIGRSRTQYSFDGSALRRRNIQPENLSTSRNLLSSAYTFWRTESDDIDESFGVESSSVRAVPSVGAAAAAAASSSSSSSSSSPSATVSGTMPDSNPGRGSGNSASATASASTSVGNTNSDYECNICFDTALSPVLTVCGHLFCWPCLHRWFEQQSQNPFCPVCKAGCGKDRVIPIYGRGKEAKDPRQSSIPDRPPGQRPASDRDSSQRGLGRSFGAHFFPGAAFHSSALGPHLSISASFSLFPAFFGAQYTFPPTPATNLDEAGRGRGFINRVIIMISFLFLMLFFL